MHSNYNEKSTTFTLRTTDIRPYSATSGYTSYTDSYRVESGTATNYGSDLTFNVNLRTLIGDQVYDKYDHFHLVMNKMDTIPYSIPSIPVNFFDTKTETCHLPFSDPNNLTLEIATGVDDIILKNNVNHIVSGPSRCNYDAIEIVATGGTSYPTASFLDLSARISDIFTRSVSIAVWVKRLGSTADGDAIWGLTNNLATSHNLVMFSATGSSMRLSDTRSGLSHNFPFPPIGEWTHYIITMGPDGTSVFINGVLLYGTITFIDYLAIAGTHFFVGVYPKWEGAGVAPSTGFDSNWNLADFRTYAKRLSPTEAGELYSNSVNRYNLLNVYLSGPQLSISGYDLKTKNNQSHAHVGIIGPLMTKLADDGNIIQYYGPWMSDTSISHINQTYPNRDIVIRKQQTIQIRLTFGGVHTDDRTIPASIFVKRPKFPYLVANFSITPIVD